MRDDGAPHGEDLLSQVKLLHEIGGTDCRSGCCFPGFEPLALSGMGMHKDGDEDCIVVSGELDFDAPDEIRFIYNEKLSYLFA